MRKKQECINDNSVIRKGKYKKKSSSIKQNSILEYHENKMKGFSTDGIKTSIKQKNKEIDLINKYIESLKEYKGTKIYPMIIDNEIKLINQRDLKHTYKEEENNSDWVTSRLFKFNEKLIKLENEKANLNKPDNKTAYLIDSNALLYNYMMLESEEELLLNNNDRKVDDTEKLNNIIKEKEYLTKEYFKKFFPEKINFQLQFCKSVICKHCNLPYIDNVCEKCGSCGNILDIPDEMSYKELQEYDKKPHFTYEKASHLSDWLRRFTASEGKVIPQEILDKVILESHKSNKKLEDLTEPDVKKYLKKLNLNDYYENVISIINRINKRPPFTLPIELEEKIKIMFSQIQEPFIKYKPPNRKNFLSYSYCLHQFFKILGLPEFSKYFTLLKSYDKLRQQDEIFKKIVAEMALKDTTVNWKFFPTI
jgi:hypothetical protein